MLWWPPGSRRRGTNRRSRRGGRGGVRRGAPPGAPRPHPGQQPPSPPCLQRAGGQADPKDPQDGIPDHRRLCGGGGPARRPPGLHEENCWRAGVPAGGDPPRRLAEVRPYEEKYGHSIPALQQAGCSPDRNGPVHPAGGSGGQLATRFIATEECDASEGYKQRLIQESPAM